MPHDPRAAVLLGGSSHSPAFSSSSVLLTAGPLALSFLCTCHSPPFIPCGCQAGPALTFDVRQACADSVFRLEAAFGEQRFAVTLPGLPPLLQPANPRPTAHLSQPTPLARHRQGAARHPEIGKTVNGFCGSARKRCQREVGRKGRGPAAAPLHVPAPTLPSTLSEAQ